MKLTKSEHNNKLVFIDSYGHENPIHLIHCNNTIEEIKEDVYDPYMVAEEAGNHSRNHLVTASDEYNAIEQVVEYLREEEGYTEFHIIIAQKLELN